MYLIFGGQAYYASGGANDLIETHDDESCAIQRAVELINLYAVTYKAKKEDLDWDEDDKHKIEWTQVYSTEKGEVIYKSDERPHAENDGVIEVVSNYT
jgi:hypothetical protein